MIASKGDSMAFKEPESMDDLLFHTIRTVEEKGKIRAWVWRPMCPKCKKGKMGKPLNPKTGKVIKKSEDFECHNCHHIITQEQSEEIGLNLEIIYTCPFCGNSGETNAPYERKNWMGVKAFVFTCQKCKEKIGITKKMKEPKKKGEVAIPEE